MKQAGTNRKLKKVIRRIIVDVFAVAIATSIMMYAFIQATLQESYKLSPLTEQEVLANE